MTKGTERLDRMLAGTYERSPCSRTLQLPVISEYRSGYVRCEHTIAACFANSAGAVFGGYLSALLDGVTGQAAMTLLPDGKTCSTAELSVSYFRPSFPGEGSLTSEAEVINQSKRLYHIEAVAKRRDG